MHASSIINLTEAAQDPFLQSVQDSVENDKNCDLVYPLTGLAGRALPVDDPDSVIGKYWRRGMGRSDSRFIARIDTTLPCKSVPHHARFASSRAGCAV